MLLQIRRTYIRDRTRNAHIYIMEFSATLEMIKERRYKIEELWDRLRIIYGRVDAVRRTINESLATDDHLRRQIGMMEFRSPYRFPDMCHSTRSQTNQNQCSESDSVFWENVPNPVDIEREHLRG